MWWLSVCACVLSRESEDIVCVFSVCVCVCVCDDKFFMSKYLFAKKILAKFLT
jgi:hypothetical protein